MASKHIIRADRAKQFLPFDSLKGLQEEIKRREEIRSRIDKIELCEEQIEEISEVIGKLVKGMIVEVQFYYNGHYIENYDRLTEINVPYHYLVLGQCRINFSDIYSIKILEG